MHTWNFRTWERALLGKRSSRTRVLTHGSIHIYRRVSISIRRSSQYDAYGSIIMHRARSAKSWHVEVLPRLSSLNVVQVAGLLSVVPRNAGFFDICDLLFPTKVV